MPKPTIGKIISELKRELVTRRRVYPRWIANPDNKLTQALADYRIGCLEEAIRYIEEAECSKVPTLFD